MPVYLAFIVLDLVYPVSSREIGWQECLQNGRTLCVLDGKWNVNSMYLFLLR